MFSCSLNNHTEQQDSVLKGKIICIDPGHGDTAGKDNFRIAPSGEREEWINLRVALMLRDMLEAKGVKVLITRTEDIHVELKDRAMLAVNNKADVFISIHHNATADRSVNFPIVYFHGAASENQAGAMLSRIACVRFRESMFLPETPLGIISDEVIFPGSGTAVLRHSYGIPGIIGEASFFSNPEEDVRLKNEAYNQKEAQTYVKILEDFFSLKKIPPIIPKFSTVKIPSLPALQEGERMNDAAKKWQIYFLKGKEMMKGGDEKSLQEAYDLLTLTTQAFPDSYIAGECHILRAEILDKLGKTEEAKTERIRSKEYYPVFE